MKWFKFNYICSWNADSTHPKKISTSPKNRQFPKIMKILIGEGGG